MTRLNWLSTFASLVCATFRYTRRRIEALTIGGMLDPLHFATHAERFERAAFNIQHKRRPFIADFEHVTATAARVFATRLREEATA